MKYEILDVMHIYYTVEAESEAEAYKKISINAGYEIKMNRSSVVDSSILLIVDQYGTVIVHDPKAENEPKEL
jgi:hypothetical protein